MKMRLLTTLIAVTCFSQAASAADLTSGSITNQTTATADVVFTSPVSVTNTLTPVNNLMTGGASEVRIANGDIALINDGENKGARLAFASETDSGNKFTSFAAGHAGDANYKLEYSLKALMPSTVDKYVGNDKTWLVSKKMVTATQYSVVAVPPKEAGKYTIVTNAAIYNP